MPGASTAPRLTPEPQQHRIAARAWSEPIVAVALGAALDGGGAPPPVEPADLADLGALVVRGPFDPRVLPPAGRHAHGPRALVAAIHHALETGGAGDRLPGRAERAVVVGTSAAALSEVIHFLDEVGRVGAALVNPGLFPYTVMNAAAGIAAIELGCEGPNITLNHGPASALDAVAYAADLLDAGRARLVFAGGFEGLGPAAAAGLNRPGEPFVGAAVVVLTTAATAAELGLEPISRLVAGASADSAAGSPMV
jgi:3-oxoacyl-(acyl-carrier-protein) synthase